MIGPPGAGKSVFAERLGRLLGIEVFHLDSLYWRRGVPPSPEEWATLERAVIERGQWIIDGNYSATLAARLQAADTAVFLDFPSFICLARFVRRRFQGGYAPGMPPGRRPSVNWATLRGIVSFRNDHRPAFLEELAKREDGLRIVVLRTQRAVRRFLAELEAVVRPEG